jgi:ribonuclease D
VIPPETRRRIDALRAWRAEAAAKLKLDVSVVLPQRLLDKVAEIAPHAVDDLAAVPGLRRWRIAEFGPDLVAACHHPG